MTYIAQIPKLPWPAAFGLLALEQGFQMHHVCCCPHRTCLTHPSAGMQGEAAALELAAAEMAQAAATLVSIERDIVDMVQNKVRAKLSYVALMPVAACCVVRHRSAWLACLHRDQAQAQPLRCIRLLGARSPCRLAPNW